MTKTVSPLFHNRVSINRVLPILLVHIEYISHDLFPSDIRNDWK